MIASGRVFRDTVGGAFSVEDISVMRSEVEMSEQVSLYYDAQVPIDCAVRITVMTPLTQLHSEPRRIHSDNATLD